MIAKRNSLCIIGFIGMGILAILSISESRTASVESMVSVIPVSILFASLFIVGYLSINKK